MINLPTNIYAQTVLGTLIYIVGYFILACFVGFNATYFITLLLCWPPIYFGILQEQSDLEVPFDQYMVLFWIIFLVVYVAIGWYLNAVPSVVGLIAWGLTLLICQLID